MNDTALVIGQVTALVVSLSALATAVIGLLSIVRILFSLTRHTTANYERIQAVEHQVRKLNGHKDTPAA